MNQTNRLGYVLGKGGFLRMLWKPNIAADAMNLVALPNSLVEFAVDNQNENLTESDSFGHYMPSGVPMIDVRVDLRRRTNDMTLEALGIRSLSMVDVVVVDHGISGQCDIYVHATPGPYNRNSAQLQAVRDGFSLVGGQLISTGIDIPTWARPAGTMPMIGGYTRSGVSVTGITGI